MLQQILPIEVFGFALVFVRVGAAFMLLPGIGEGYVSPRLRLSAAIAVTFLIAPFVSASLPAEPGQPVQAMLLILNETLIGVFVGGAARLALSALGIAGTVIAFQSGLGFGMFYDPTQGNQGAAISSFLSIVGLVMIFAANLHLVVLRAAADSYQVFPPGALPPLGDFAATVTNFVAGAFELGLRISAPFIIYGLVFYVGLGVLGRLMPQAQVTFLAMPLQIGTSLLLLMLTLGAAMLWFLDYFEGAMGAFLVK